MALKDITITGSINSYPTLSYGQKTYIASTDEQSFPIEHITGSAGGATPDFNGQVATTNLFVNITQSWPGSNDTPLGLVDFVHDTEEEFINGEYSGSAIQVADQRLIDEDCAQYLTPSTIPTNFKLYFYNTPTFPLGKIPLNSPRYEEYLTAKAYRDNFLNPNTSPNPGEIYILTTVSEKLGIPPALPPSGKTLINSNTWIFGDDVTKGSSNLDKFAYLNTSDAILNEDFLILYLQSYKINDEPAVQLDLRSAPSIEIYPGEVVYRDDGYGLFPINYVDFINGIIEDYSFSTRITGSSTTGDKKFISNYFESEIFSFTFVESGQIEGGEFGLTSQGRTGGPSYASIPYFTIFSDQGNLYDYYTPTKLVITGLGGVVPQLPPIPGINVLPQQYANYTP